MKIGLLIPSTSNGRNEWKTYKDTYLYNSTLKTFLLTYDQEHEYIFYIGVCGVVDFVHHNIDTQYDKNMNIKDVSKIKNGDLKKKSNFNDDEEMSDHTLHSHHVEYISHRVTTIETCRRKECCQA